MFVKRRHLLSFLTGLVISVSLFSERGVEAAKKQPCKTCKEFVVSFEKRFKDTEKSNYAGGDTSWEEEKLGSYANSEVRLVEILDGVCRHSDYDCHRILENNEEYLEIWWFKLRHNDGKADLKHWLCHSHLDVCCPKNTYGPSCEECPGGVANPCGGRGSCEGSEEKDGSGKCSCNKGYEGETCQVCSKGYFNDTDEEGEKLTCEACDKACKDSCSAAGADMCDECAEGYELEEEMCKDIDECKDEDICKEGTYCFNLQGSHKCNACDKACDKICNGPGPSKCAECAKGYARDRAGVCKDENECEDGSPCAAGTYCENRPGKYVCQACHVSCKQDCHGPGAGGCVECRDGYSMENETCTDVDECSGEAVPCDLETEVCHNLLGSYVCKCREGLIKSSDGSCVTEDQLPPEERPKKAKKKRRVKKGGKKKSTPKKKEREEKDELKGDIESQLRTQEFDSKSDSGGETDSISLESPPPPVIAGSNEEHGSSGSQPSPSSVKQDTNLTPDRLVVDSSEQNDSGASETSPENEQIRDQEEFEPSSQPESPRSSELPATESEQIKSETAAVNVSEQRSSSDGQGRDENGVLHDIKSTSGGVETGKDEQLHGETHEEL